MRKLRDELRAGKFTIMELVIVIVCTLGAIASPIIAAILVYALIKWLAHA